MASAKPGATEDPVPQHKSAKKRLKTSAVARVHNRAIKSNIKTAIKKLEEAGSPDEAQALLSTASSLLDRAAKRHIMHPSTAARKKSRLARAIARQN